jgi:Replication initiator protein A/DnaA N-terminal domain
VAHHKEEQPSSSLTKVESNLEEFPLFQLGRKRQKGTATYERTIKGKNGSLLRQRFEVSSSKYSLPGPMDMDVYLAVLELLETRGGMPESGKLYFSLYELINILGWQPGGRTYAKLKESLRRIALTGIESENAFYSKGGDRHISDTFRLWSVHFSEKNSQKGDLTSRHHIRFDEWFIQSFQDYYLKGLDTNFYWELSSPLPRRLYRLVDHKIGDGTRWEVDLFDLRYQIPLAEYRYASKIKSVLKPAHEELTKKGFLAGVEYLEGNRMLFRISQSFAKRKRALEFRGTPEDLIAIQTLRDEGMSGDVARDLVACYGPRHCLKYADALPHQKNLRSPAGWLRRAIEEGYELPLSATAESHTAAASRKPLAGDEQGTEGEKRKSSPISDPRAEEVWKSLLEEIFQEINSPSLHVWFEGTVPTSFEDSILTLQVPNDFALQYIEERFGEMMKRVLRERVGINGEVEIKCWQSNSE